jgi:hypothetical protein
MHCMLRCQIYKHLLINDTIHLLLNLLHISDHYLIVPLSKECFKKEKSGLSNDQIDLMAVFIRNKVNSCFETLSTEHRQRAFYREKNQTIEPVEIKNDSDTLGYIIPFKEKLEKFLQMPENKDMLNSETSLPRNDYSSDIGDGEYIKKLKNQNVQLHKPYLLFGLYYDDIEVVNAIGASRKSHKLGKYVYVLFNLYINEIFRRNVLLVFNKHEKL